MSFASAAAPRNGGLFVPSWHNPVFAPFLGGGNAIIMPHKYMSRAARLERRGARQGARVPAGAGRKNARRKRDKPGAR